jgi:hypothetical protein
MADSRTWSKAQAERLEEARAQELELSTIWWKTEKAKKEEKEKKMEGKGWAWGSWWSGQWDGSTDKRWSSGGASGSQSNDPPQNAEPTASSKEKSDTAQWLYPSRSAEVDHCGITPITREYACTHTHTDTRHARTARCFVVRRLVVIWIGLGWAGWHSVSLEMDWDRLFWVRWGCLA